MSEDSKKRQELKRQLENKAQTANIKSVEKALNFLASPKKFDIIEHITIPTSNSGRENQRFIICFDYFNWKTSDFEQFNPAKGKKLLEILEQVAKCEINKFPELKLSRDSVEKVSPYESLFTTVTPEVKRIEETEFCDGRFFFIVTEPYFHVISVETKHR